MKKILLITLIVLGIATFGITSSQAEILNFDDLDLPGTGFTIMQTYSSQGFFLENSRDAVNAFEAPQKDNGFYFGNANLIITFQSEWATLTKPDSSFTLNSIDLHGFIDVSNVEFFAFNSDEEQVANKQFALNDINSWHTVDFDSNFQNVDSVKWQQGASGYHSFDNIVLNNVVPEPVSCVLFGVGGLTLAAFRRFRKK